MNSSMNKENDYSISVHSTHVDDNGKNLSGSTRQRSWHSENYNENNHNSTQLNYNASLLIQNEDFNKQGVVHSTGVNNSSNGTIFSIITPIIGNFKSSSNFKILRKTFEFLLLTIFIIPFYVFIHFNPYLMPYMYKIAGRTERPFPPKQVNQNTCTCDCWDQGTTGIYSKSNRFFHVYINSTSSALGFLVIMYSLFTSTQLILHRIIQLILKKEIDWWVTLGLIFNIPTFQYGLGVIATYINDSNYSMYYSQIPYTISETIVTIILYWLLDKRINIPIIIWIVIYIDGMSLLKSILDHLVSQESKIIYSFLRTLVFIFPDFLHLAVLIPKLPNQQKKNYKLWLIFLSIVSFLIFIQWSLFGTD